MKCKIVQLFARQKIAERGSEISWEFPHPTKCKQLLTYSPGKVEISVGSSSSAANQTT